MTDVTPRQQLIALIAIKRAEATRLLLATTEDGMQAQVRLAILDLDEGLGWLNQHDVKTGSFVFKNVDRIVAIAATRLALVQEHLDTREPDAPSVG